VATLLLAGPLAGAAVTGAQGLLMVAGLLGAGTAGVDRALAIVSLALAGAFLALASWQHRTLGRSLREIASDARGAEPRRPLPERDPLTGLLTAAALHARARSLLDRPSAEPVGHLLLVVDIAHLRDVNGAHGFDFGDRLLRQFARRLGAIGETMPAAARMGGDRFALLVANPDGAGSAAAAGTAVTDALARPFLVMGCEVSVRVHSGIALFPEHGASFDLLMRAAELALESARRTDTRWQLYDPQLNRAAIARKTMEKELKRALEDGQLRLHYQPQIDLATGGVLAVEALLRWQHPERGLVPPQSFIPIAEASGLIRPIGSWVLAEACKAARRWRDAGLTVGVTVNVSAAQLKHQDLPATVHHALDASALAPDLLELELTESMFVDPAELVVHRAVQAVAAMGVRLAIDDFGTGYSSLGYLKRLPVHKIKIDKSFVRGLGGTDDLADAAIVRSIIGLARSFNKRVLAEGIEEAGQYRFLAAEGCHEGQGFYFARPMPEAACTEFLGRHGHRAAGTDAGQLLAG
jgi:diguanylate cyclase (GGDEF)-like protein